MDKGTLAAIIVVSDRVISGERPNYASLMLRNKFADYSLEVIKDVVVPEGYNSVHSAIREALDLGCQVIVTAGGSGLAESNKTPEATENFIDMRLRGLETQVLLEGLKNTPLAGLSRGVIGVTVNKKDERCLIVNAPGSKGGVSDACAVILPLLPHIFEK